MRKWRIFVLALLVVLCFTSYTYAAYSPSFNDRPTVFDPGKIRGYFLWQDKEGFHLRTTSNGGIHNFSGTVRTDGRFKDVLENYKGDSDFLEVNKSQNKMKYNITASEEEEGIDFQLSYGSYIKFSLSLDNEAINSNEIFIGKDGWHPVSHDFTILYDGDYTKYIDGQTILIIDSGLGRPRGAGHGRD